MTINIFKIHKTNNDNLVDVEFYLNGRCHIINDVPVDVANDYDIAFYIIAHADEVFYLHESDKVNVAALATECGAAAIDEFRENCVYENNAVWDVGNCNSYISSAQFYLLCQGLEIEGSDGSFYSLHEEAE